MRNLPRRGTKTFIERRLAADIANIFTLENIRHKEGPLREGMRKSYENGKFRRVGGKVGCG